MFSHQQSLNLYHKPATVTFTFHQKRFDKSGELRDDRGTVVYRFKDLGEEHTFGFAKSYVSFRSEQFIIDQEHTNASKPLEIRGAKDNKLVASLHWHDKPKKTTVEGMTGHRGLINIDGGLMDEEYVSAHMSHIF